MAHSKSVLPLNLLGFCYVPPNHYVVLHKCYMVWIKNNVALSPMFVCKNISPETFEKNLANVATMIMLALVLQCMKHLSLPKQLELGERGQEEKN